MLQRLREAEQAAELRDRVRDAQGGDGPQCLHRAHQVIYKSVRCGEPRSLFRVHIPFID